MKTVWKYLRYYKLQSILAPLFKCLEATFELFVPLVISDIIDNGIVNGDRQAIVRSFFLLIGLAVVGLISALTAQYFSAAAAVGCSSRMRSALFNHIQGFSYESLDSLGSSTLITRMTSDINQVQNGVNMTLRLFMRSPFIVFGAMIMAFTIDVKAASIFAVVIVLLMIVVFGIMAITRPMYRNVQAGLDNITRLTRENLTGVRVIRAFNKQQSEVENFHDKNDFLKKLQNAVGRISGVLNPITYIIINAGILYLIWVGALRVNSGELTTGQVVALYNYMSQILVELIKLANLIVTITKAVACANRVEAVFDMEEDDQAVIAGKKDAALREAEDSVKTAALREAEDSVKTAAGKINISSINSIEMKKLGFKYADAVDNAISDINIEIKSGETLGIIGGTGSGKSTLVNLIPGFYQPSEGEYLINGRSVKEIDPYLLRRKVSIVSQKNELFSGTVRSNISMGLDDPSDETLINALKTAQAYDFVMEKEGLDTEVLQSGKNFSGGQKQRICIARALAKEPDVIILDDSSSALDMLTDMHLRKAIRENNRGIISVIVSQRTAAVMDADKILVLDDGELVGYGSHEELLNKCDIYKEIYASQYGEVSDNE